MRGRGVEGFDSEPYTLAEIPVTFLRAELERRQDDFQKPSCGSRSSRGSYNTPLHVFALFLILVLSTIGVRLSVRCKA